MFGKAITQLIRLSCVLQAFENAIGVIKKIECDSNSLNKEFKAFVKANIKQGSVFFIDKKTLQRAKNLVEYFTINRLLMADYKCSSTDSSNKEILEQILSEISIGDSQISNKVIKKILLMPGLNVRLSDVRKTKVATSEIILKNINSLVSDGFGKLVADTNKGKKSKKNIFIKPSMKELDENLELIAIIEKYKINLRDYAHSFKTGKNVKFIFFS